MANGLTNSNEPKEILLTIKQRCPRMSKSHKKIAAYIQKNFERIPEMSAIKIARLMDVSEATVVRFAMSLGFEGYLEFRKALRDEVNNKLTTVERIDMSLENEMSKDSQIEVIRSVLTSDIKNVSETLNSLDYESLDKCADVIQNARKVILIGFRTTFYLAEHLGYYLNLILDDVRTVGPVGIDTFEELIKVDERDVVIAMSFPRYAQRTYDVAKFLSSKTPHIVAITDREAAPINGFAEHHLYAKSDVYSFVDTMVAPLSMINALIVAVSLKNIENTKKTFQELEEVWHKNTIYQNEDQDDEGR